MKKILLLPIFIFALSFNLFSQTGDDEKTQVYLIDSYITQETPHKFILSFFTSERVKAKVVLEKKYEFDVSKRFTEDHKIEIEIDRLEFDSLRIPFVIHVEDSLGKKSRSDRYDVEFPFEHRIKSGSTTNRLLTCCFGGVIFGLPSPTYVRMNDKNYFSLTKEVPIVSFYNESFGLPFGYFAAEYSYIFEAERKNYFRIGYKQIFETSKIRFISLGLNGITDFSGYNGISPEVSLGLFKFYEVFTVVSKYRYNFVPGKANSDFHEISIGLYSNFFTFRIDF